ncbi:MAG: prenyltransferase/squalene oxidase repeat-containing protein [Planctomycetota bacterium]|jgi:squalene-hopene/tetraprenyl-beta-curcumene cyclase
MRASFFVLFALVLVVGCSEDTSAPPSPTGGEPAPREGSIEKQFTAGYEKAADWLTAQQDESGAWMQALPQGGKVPSLGFTGLAVAALAGGPLKAKYKDNIKKAVKWLVFKQNEDGSFGEGSDGQFLKSYGTAIALMAFTAVDPKKEKLADKIRGAQAYLKHNQVKEGVHRGGSGYGDLAPGEKGIRVKEYANMSTTGFTAEALRLSGLPKDDEFWKLVIEFCRSVQNSTEVNKNEAFLKQLKEKGLSIGDDGSLFYTPIADPEQASKAGTKKLVDKEVIIGYGSMTYDGIKTYLYAGLGKDSPEVRAAMDWVRKNYAVDMHPGFPYDAEKRGHLMGLYYYYVVMARALDAYGETVRQSRIRGTGGPEAAEDEFMTDDGKVLKTFDGKEHAWANELAEHLLKLQDREGFWKNKHSRWYEGIPELTTSYVLLTGNTILRNIK